MEEVGPVEDRRSASRERGPHRRVERLLIVGLHDGADAGAASSELEDLPGVVGVTLNTVTRSFDVVFDRAVVSDDELVMMGGGDMEPIVSRGFKGRRANDVPNDRVPPGQYVTDDYPVLSAGPTPHTSLDRWDFSIGGEVEEPRRWTWEEFRALPTEEITVDIHCVTKWSKLDTSWHGVSIDTLLDGIDTSADYVVQYSDGGYTTNLPLEDLTDGKAWVAFEFDGKPLEPEHGGPARMLVPHLYFWKSAKWIRGLRLLAADEPGFWEINGYHNYGDPWREQRYWGD